MALTLILLIALLIATALFSGAETALFGLSRHELSQFRHDPRIPPAGWRAHASPAPAAAHTDGRQRDHQHVHLRDQHHVLRLAGRSSPGGWWRWG